VVSGQVKQGAQGTEASRYSGIWHILRIKTLFSVDKTTFSLISRGSCYSWGLKPEQWRGSGAEPPGPIPLHSALSPSLQPNEAILNGRHLIQLATHLSTQEG